MKDTISTRDLKILCTRSGNRCALPDCRKVLVTNATEKDRESLVAEKAHIKGERPTAPRYDANMTDKERNAYGNRIYVCSSCHKVIDDQPRTYTVEKLHQIKSEHEAWVVKQTEKEVMNVTFSELDVVTKFLVSEKQVSDDTFTVIPPKEKIKKNSLSATTERMITMGMTQVKQVSHFIDNCPDLEFGQRLKQGFVDEYERLKNEEGMAGDDLFNGLLDFASGNSGDFRHKAAGLSVLVYLFEKCEVFEK